MKPLSIFLALAATPLFGADATLPEFNSSAIGHPPLSLSDSTKPDAKPFSFSGKVPTLDELGQGLLGANPRPEIPRTPAPSRFAPKSGPWNMPVLIPKPGIDYKIVLKEPDPRVDFKMLIQPPAVDPAPAK